MIEIREIESSTQEVNLLLTVVGAASLLLGGLFFIKAEPTNLPLLAGQFGIHFFHFLFGMFGYASFYLSFAILNIGRYLIGQGLSIKEVFQLYPQVLTRFTTHLFSLIILSGLLSVFHQYYGFNINQRLEEGAGGVMGSLVGGTFFEQFGFYGSLTLLITMAIVVGISLGYIRLVNILLFLGEKISYIYDRASKRVKADLKSLATRIRYEIGEHIQFFKVEAVSPEGIRVDGIGQPEEEQEIQTAGETKPMDAPISEWIKKVDQQLHDLEEHMEDANPIDAKGPINKKVKQGADNKTKEDIKEESETNKELDIEIKSFVGTYQKPEISILDKIGKESLPAKKELEEQCRELEERLDSFQIKGKIIDAHVGPNLTMYEFDPAPGMKLSRITGLTNDLALVLGAESIRILAPIPGKTTVGIEVPREKPSAVSFPKLINKTIAKKEMALPIPMGLNVYNETIISDIATMPHLLVSGTTGSGKSVFINTLITSLLFHKSPKDLRFLMIDPKMIELSPYNGIPHLLKPVVTDVNEAKDLLVWAEKEMDRRYQKFAQTQARNIDSFNETIKNSNQKTVERKLKSKIDWKWQHMPYIVIVIDELADLMITQGKDVEIPITRIAQKARAAGIHLVIATQRPSAEIVTGLIKTNFPTRISFKVSSAIDSRTILDSTGGEKLLGKGDMLYMPNGKGLERLQGALISENEVKKIVKKLS